MRHTALGVLGVLSLALPSFAALSPRSQELLDARCESRIGSQRVTLFGNGTVRLKERPPEAEERMLLGELGAAELGAYRRRLEAIELGEQPVVAASPGGDWVERCTVRLELREGEPVMVSYGRFDTVGLGLRDLINVVEELAAIPSDDTAGLPEGYAPRQGDVLRRRDDVLYRVVGLTWDGTGVELEGVEEPLTIYVSVDQLREEFRELVGPRPR